MPRDEVVMLLGLARALKHATVKAQKGDYSQWQRLNQRLQTVDRRIRDLMAGQDTQPWPFDANYYYRYGL